MPRLSILPIFLVGLVSLFGCTGENSVEVTTVNISANPDSTPEDSVVLDHRIGPVSQYGELIAAAPTGEGRIYGKCKGAVAGNEVQVRGMSLYWSIMPRAVEFFTEAAITTMVKDMKIEIIRIAVATDENWGGGIMGFNRDPDTQRQLIKQVVDAAVKNDIYVIIDWHSHTAENQLMEAYNFFTEMAMTYGHLDNVIFEVYNEPKGSWGLAKGEAYWPTIRNYAETVISAIRLFSDNLVLVGTPFYDQFPNAALSSPVNFSNVAYTFHYYANSHSVVKEGANAVNAMRGGLSIFVSEWGTGNADGKGTPGLEANNEWQNWLNNYKLSSANWSASKINEGTAAFTGESTENQLYYSESGTLVKYYLSTNPDSYTQCKK